MTSSQRIHAVHIMQQLYYNRIHFGYPQSDQRTDRDNFTWHLTETQLMNALEKGETGIQMDCSETCSWILKACGCWPWNSAGYTGSHLDSIYPQYTEPKIADPGALVIFGGGTGHHEAMVLTADHNTGNPMLYSHGEPGGKLITLSDEANIQKEMGYPGVRFLSVEHLG